MVHRTVGIRAGGGRVGRGPGGMHTGIIRHMRPTRDGTIILMPHVAGAGPFGFKGGGDGVLKKGAAGRSSCASSDFLQGVGASGL